MKCVSAVIMFLGALMFLVPPAAADWPMSVEKWNQLQGVDSYAAASWIDTDSPSDALTADDFLCTQPVPVIDIHFAGYSYYGTAYIDKFRITFWSDVPATPNDESHPGDLLYDELIEPAQPGDPLALGWQDMLDGTFRINLPSYQWFWQQGSETSPTVYWIGIQGLMVEDGYFDAFYWNFRDRNLPTWGDDAALQSDYFGYPPWYNWAWTSDAEPAPDLYDGPFDPGLFWKSADMAFTLTTVPEPGAIVLLLGGGLCLLAFAWRRRSRAD